MSDSEAGNALMELEFPVEVWLASEEVELERLIALEPGEVLPLERDPDGPVDLVVNGSVVASGELVVVDGKFGFRVTESTLHKLATMDGEPPRPNGGEES